MLNRRVVIVSGASHAVILCCLLSCTTGSTGDPSSANTPSGLAVLFADAFCTAQASCCGMAITTADGGTADASLTDAATCRTAAASEDSGVSSCQARALLAANEQLALVSTAFSEGLLSINPNVATTCAATYQNASCSAFADRGLPNIQAAINDPTCANLFIGYIPENYRCDMTAECVMGSFCLSKGTGQPLTSIAGSGSLGICFAYQQSGNPCNTSADCQPPASCNVSTFTCE